MEAKISNIKKTEYKIGLATMPQLIDIAYNQVPRFNEEFCYDGLPPIDPESFLTTWIDYLRDPSGAMFTCFNGEEFVGFIDGIILKSPLNKNVIIAREINWFVDKKHRSEGIGKKLLIVLEEWAKNNGATHIQTTLMKNEKFGNSGFILSEYILLKEL